MARISLRLLTLTAVCTTLSLVVATDSSATASLKAPSHPIAWLAAGDSYASGQGLPDLTKTCARGTGMDGLSATWAVVAARELKTQGVRTDPPELVACTGAYSANFFVSAKGQRAQWSPQASGGNAKGQFDLATFSFGGDDIGVTSIVEHCLEQNFKVGRGCPPDTAVRKKISELGDGGLTNGSLSIASYPTFLRHVATSAIVKGGNVVVMGYPEVVEDPTLWPAGTTTCDGFSAAQANEIRGWAGDLNATIGNSVTKVNALPASARNDVHFTFIDVVTGQSTTGIASSSPDLYEPSSGTRHELCSAGGQPWLNALQAHRHTHSFHPDQAGSNAMAALLDQVVGELSWPWSPPQVAFDVCSTQADVGTPQPQATKATSGITLTGVPPMAMYGDDEGHLSVLAPQGWTCNASIAEDSTEGLTVAPKGANGSAGSTPSDGISADLFPGTDIGDMYQAVCRLFPSSATSSINIAGLPCSAPALPSAQKNAALSPEAVSFSDPPGVSGTVDNSKGTNDAQGVVIFVPNKGGNPFEAEVVCTLPAAQRSACTAVIKDFAARYQSGTNSSPSAPSAVAPSATTTTSTTAAPTSTAPCTSSALAIPWVGFGIPDFQALWFACQNGYALVGGYSANVGYSVALLQTNGAAWSYVAQPNDGTCFATTSTSGQCPEVASWPISNSEVGALASQAGLSLDTAGDVSSPPGWSPPAPSGNTGSTGASNTGTTGNSP